MGWRIVAVAIHRVFVRWWLRRLVGWRYYTAVAIHRVFVRWWLRHLYYPTYFTFAVAELARYRHAREQI